MTEITVTLGRVSAPSLCLLWSAQSLFFVTKAIRAFAEGDFGWAIGHTIVSVLGAIIVWNTQRHWNNGTTRLTWDGNACLIEHAGEILFRGELSRIERISADGRGCFLLVACKRQIRLRRRDVPPDLAEALDHQWRCRLGLL